MKRLLFACLVLASCSKEEQATDVSFTASGRMCAVEYINGDGIVRRDTIIGTLDYSGDVVDTIPAKGKWNIVIENGDRLYIRACHLRADSIDGPIQVISSLGDTCDSWGGPCATIDRSFH